MFWALHPAQTTYMLSSMSPTMLFALTIVVSLVVLALCAVALWRSRRSDKTTKGLENGPRRFNTTMGELRDMREALGANSRQSRQRG